MYRRSQIVLLCLLTAFISLTIDPAANAAESLELRTEYRVLAVGIDDYRAPLGRLRGCTSDARAIGNLLGYGNPSAQVLLDRDATREKILSACNGLVDQAKEGERVALFLAGHGMRLGKRWFYAPVDAGDGDPEQAFITGGHLLQTIEALVAKRCTVLVMIDACHSGEFAKQCDRSFRQWITPGRGGAIVLASSSGSETSFSGLTEGINDQRRPHGLFTTCLLDALSPRSSFGIPEHQSIGQLQTVTLKTVKTFVATAMRERVDQYPKPLGIPRKEQGLVAEWSSSISETLPLVEYGPGTGPYAPIPLFGTTPKRDTKLAAAIPALTVNPSEHSLLGTWKASRTFNFSHKYIDGKPTHIPQPDSATALLKQPDRFQIRRDILLHFTVKGSYVVGHSASDRKEPLIGGGRYVFKPGETFELHHETGIDKLGLVSLTKDELVLEYHAVGTNLVTDPQARNPERWTFKRLSARK